MFKTPILLLTFNRPDLTRKVISVIAKVKPEKLYFASDGPRNGYLDDQDLICETRNVLNDIDWTCDIKTLFRDENLGCKLSVSSAINWFFSNEPYGIILEDDCLPNITFFQFCEELLIKYQNDDRVALISGQRPTGLNFFNDFDYQFTRYATIWGWASWKRFWINYDVDIHDWPKNKSNFLKSFKNVNNEKFWSIILDSIYNNKVDTWDYQLVYCILRLNKKVIIPRVNLVSNIGFDNRATHTTDINSKMANQITGNIFFPLRHNLELNFTGIDKYFEEHIFLSHSLYSRFKIYLKAKFIRFLTYLFK